MPIHNMGYSRAQVDPDKAFAVQISHDESVVAGPVAYVQCALLYTSSSGERRIRHAPLVTHLFYRQSHQEHRALKPNPWMDLYPPPAAWCKWGEVQWDLGFPILQALWTAGGH